MHHARIWIGLAAVVWSATSSAANREVLYAGIPKWVIPLPSPTDTKTPDGASYRIVYADQQIEYGSNGIESFQGYRLKILRADALALGNVTLSWSPDAGEARVHYVRIVRDKTVIDVLKSNTFQVLQREGSLERATLNGELTAALQVPGLQVDDELEVAATIRRKDPTLGDHLFGFAQLPATGQPGAFRIRMVMPKSGNVHWQISPDVTGVAATTAGGQTEILFELRDPHTAVIADGAPARANIRRFIEVSDFDSWADVSRRFWPLFEKASVLAPQSSVRKEVARIAAASTDPIKRMEAALQLVQDRIRYVYIGLNGGNFMPATVEQTWERRFGDCKAKTALLLAVLRELGIPGEATLVNSHGGDGINERLPTPAVFDHVVVRAVLADKTYWLDGSRLEDRRLVPQPEWRWVLPVRAGGAALERLPSDPPKSPDTIVVIDVDSSKGFDQKAAVKIQHVLHGDGALEIRAKLSVLSPEDADRGLRAYWHQVEEWVEPEAVAWRYDEQRTTVLLSLSGRGKVDWTGGDADGRSLNIFGAGFTPPAEYHRPNDQDQTAPWLIEYPAFRCWVTAIHLPDGGSKWKWDYDSDPIDTHLGGVDYWRLADMRDGVIRTIMSRRIDVPEITAAQAEEVNKGLLTFNNNMSRVYQIALNDREPNHKRLAAVPFQTDTDWTSPDTLCVPQPQLSWIAAPTVAAAPTVFTIPTVVDTPSIHSLGGVMLGATPSQLTHAMGEPLKKMAPGHWIYNSIDNAHDGMLDVLFSDDSTDESRTVRMVMFSGTRGAEPAGMAKLLGRTRESLVRLYGDPMAEAPAGPDSQTLFFRNGVAVLIVSGKTAGYGIFDVAKWRSR